MHGTGDFDDPRVPATSLVLGIGPMLLLPIAALCAWTTPQPWPLAASWLGIGWAAILLIFLGGVRRGLSFHRPGGAPLGDLAAMLWLFVLGAGAIVVATPLEALTLLIVGYASVAVLDRNAALRGHAPRHFARLRPVQMAVALVGLVGLAAFRLSVA